MSTSGQMLFQSEHAGIEALKHTDHVLGAAGSLALLPDIGFGFWILSVLSH